MSPSQCLNRGFIQLLLTNLRARHKNLHLAASFFRGVISVYDVGEKEGDYDKPHVLDDARASLS